MLALAGVSCASGSSMLGCSERALLGGAVLYVVSRVALRLVVAILVSAVMSSPPSGRTPEKTNREFGQ